MKTEKEIKALLDKAESDYVNLNIALFEEWKERKMEPCFEYKMLHFQDTINLLRDILGMDIIKDNWEQLAENEKN